MATVTVPKKLNISTSQAEAYIAQQKDVTKIEPAPEGCRCDRCGRVLKSVGYQCTVEGVKLILGSKCVYHVMHGNLGKRLGKRFLANQSRIVGDDESSDEVGHSLTLGEAAEGKTHVRNFASVFVDEEAS